MAKFRIRLWEVQSEWEVEAKDREEAERKGWGTLNPSLEGSDYRLDVEEVEEEEKAA